MSEDLVVPPPAPVEKDELAQMEQLMNMYSSDSHALVQLELSKPRLLMSLNRTLEAKAALEQKWLKDRNLPANTPFEVDPETGEFRVVTPGG